MPTLFTGMLPPGTAETALETAPTPNSPARRKYLCPCGKRRDKCREHGTSFCECGRRRELCARHGGSALCICGRRREYCLLHGGSALCPCGRRRNVCLQHGGTSLCPCNKRLHLCREHGAAFFCPCNKRKEYCRLHMGSQICVHQVRRSSCAQCDPAGHLMRLARNATRRAFKRVGEKKSHTTRHWLGCSDDELQAFIAKKMQRWNEQYAEEMTLANTDLDHIKPISTARTLEDIKTLAHFSNLQPLLKKDNASKSARWCAADEGPWLEHTRNHAMNSSIFWPSACPALSAPGIEWRSLHVLARVALAQGSDSGVAEA